MSTNIADGGLLDVREIGVAELSSAASGSTALDDALDRILSSNSGCNFNSFTSSI
jgi:hypothetical protein